MDISDSQIDDEITYTLTTQVIITPAQKQAAWERLQAQAARQVILAPYAAPPKVQIERSVLSILVQYLVTLFTDETCFQRAADNRSLSFEYRRHLGGMYYPALYFPGLYLRNGMF